MAYIHVFINITVLSLENTTNPYREGVNTLDEMTFYVSGFVGWLAV